MRTYVRRMVGLAFALAVTFAIAGLSRVPYTAADGDHALIRFSWRTAGAHVEECRRLSEEELEQLPVHMRRDEVCERRILPYRLVVHIDGSPIYDETVRPAGAREDRPLYVFRELSVQRGHHSVQVLWEQQGEHRAVPAGEAADAAGVTQGGSGEIQRERAPTRLTLDADVLLRDGDIALITYDVDERRLVLRGGAAPGLSDSVPVR